MGKSFSSPQKMSSILMSKFQLPNSLENRSIANSELVENRKDMNQLFSPDMLKP